VGSGQCLTLFSKPGVLGCERPDFRPSGTSRPVNRGKCQRPLSSDKEGLVYRGDAMVISRSGHQSPSIVQLPQRDISNSALPSWVTDWTTKQDPVADSEFL
jgi:hypothetical protein